MGRILLLVWAVLSSGILFARSQTIPVSDIDRGPQKTFTSKKTYQFKGAVHRPPARILHNRNFPKQGRTR